MSYHVCRCTGCECIQSNPRYRHWIRLNTTRVHGARLGGAILTAEPVERPISLADLLPYAPREDRADIECSNYYDQAPQARINYPEVN